MLSGVEYAQVLWRAGVFRFDWYTVMLQLVSCNLSCESTKCCSAKCGKAEVCGRAEQVVLALSSIAVCGNILPQARLHHNEWHAPVMFAKNKRWHASTSWCTAMQTRTPVCSFLVAAAVLMSLSTDRLLNASEFLGAGAYAASRCAAVVRVTHATGMEELGATSAYALPLCMSLLVVLVALHSMLNAHGRLSFAASARMQARLVAPLSCVSHCLRQHC